MQCLSLCVCSCVLCMIDKYQLRFFPKLTKIHEWSWCCWWYWWNFNWKTTKKKSHNQIHMIHHHHHHKQHSHTHILCGLNVFNFDVNQSKKFFFRWKSWIFFCFFFFLSHCHLVDDLNWTKKNKQNEWRKGNPKHQDYCCRWID